MVSTLKRLYTHKTYTKRYVFSPHSLSHCALGKADDLSLTHNLRNAWGLRLKRRYFQLWNSVGVCGIT